MGMRLNQIFAFIYSPNCINQDLKKKVQIMSVCHIVLLLLKDACNKIYTMVVKRVGSSLCTEHLAMCINQYAVAHPASLIM